MINSITNLKSLAFILGPTFAVIIGLSLNYNGWESNACWAGAIATLCAIWWIFEPLPIPATSLIPLAIFPTLNIMSHQEVAAAYGHKLILLLLGGFILSVAMEKSGAHKKIANGIIKTVGTQSKKKIVLSFMLASALLSMWISNTATTLMLLPIILAFLNKCEDRTMDLPVLLGVAYAASIGGIGTPIGTPPNIVFMSEYQASTGKEISFMKWMKIALPVVILALPIIWLWLTRRVKGG